MDYNYFSILNNLYHQKNLSIGNSTYNNFYNYMSNYLNEPQLMQFSFLNNMLIPKNRFLKMLNNKCSSVIKNSKCLNNPNINSFEQISFLRKNCFSEWKHLTNCSTKNFGESFTIELKLLSTKGDLNENEYNKMHLYNETIKRQFTFIKEDLNSNVEETE